MDERRQYWRDKYKEWDKISNELCNEDNDISLLIESSLHDMWSEIRNDSSKSLKRLQQYISINTLLKLGHNLLLKINDSSIQWQTLHGSILGLKSICNFLIRLDSITRDKFHNDVIKSCLSIVIHDMLPIREASRDCIVEYLNIERSYIKYCDFTYSVLNSISKLKQQVGSASTFDGLLGCLVDIIQRSNNGLQVCSYFDDKKLDNDTSSLTTSSSSSSSSSSSFIHNENLLFKCTIACFNHDASTVRQRAASVLLSLYKLKNNNDDNNNDNNNETELQIKMKYSLLNVLHDCIMYCIIDNNNDDTNWKILETCLIISEVILIVILILILIILLIGCHYNGN